MSLKRTAAIALAGLMSVGTIATVFAEDFVVPGTPEEIVIARQTLMKQDGGLLKNAGGLTGDEAVTTLETLLTNYGHIPALFPENTIVGDSEALPVIWEKFDDFTAIVETGKTAIQAAIDAAKAGDATTYMASIKAIGGTCGQCHSTYRAQ